jgi:hypothetical protein
MGVILSQHLNCVREAERNLSEVLTLFCLKLRRRYVLILSYAAS